ncbi:hypothetical protein Poli38472_013769 [Pythium oligandrum]|uniref:Uncharacterized protein n=1 Tax=Pythium oligandrum TaxID=41045 RepID=A0A8K1FG65_PYTOL|nr:hypothetical protein Poli38472_013769 [Pythium oligandrum]|eukprot:TMW61306.1 hypothetical protein Poli38472_013769 [Pythium oligandrum]
MVPMPPPPGAASPESNDEREQQLRREMERAVDCNVCLGVSIYSRAMLEHRKDPDCKGISMVLKASPERMDELRERAAKPRSDNFTLYSVGLSMYSPDWMKTGVRVPAVRGLGMMVIRTDPDELMKRMEQHKRIKRELEDENDDDGGDLVIDFGDEDENDDDGSGLVEKGPLGSMPTRPPRLPPVLPTMSLEDLARQSVENAKTMTRAMYNFWAKRLDGFGERYQESCRRIFQQMSKQARAIPNSITWAHGKIKEIEEQVRGGGRDGPEPRH